MDRNHARASQVLAHVQADRKRLETRLETPAIRAKELLLAKAIVAEAASRGEARVLEVGCGEGANLIFLSKAAPDITYYGIDFSPAKLRLAGDVSSASLACADALDLPFADHSFDLVLCRDILHHVDWDREGLLREAIRVAAPGAAIVVIEANGRTLLNRIFRMLFPFERGLVNSTPESLMALGERFGSWRLEMIEPALLVRAVGFVLGPPRGWRKFFALPVYRLAALIEQAVEMVIPRSKWAYMMLVVRR